MKQLIQDLQKGKTFLEEVPVPTVKRGTVLIKTTHSLVSLGTERMLVEFSRASLINKARQQPDRVMEVLNKIKTDGILPTLEAVLNKLRQPLPLGYCNVGIVEEIGKGVTGFQVGDRVSSNGNHAEYVCIPQNLIVKIPNNVSNEEAAFTVIGSIGLEGIRLCNPTFGETIVVIGLGLIGLLTAELLKSNGCKVIGYDFDQQKVELAINKGILAFNPTKGNDPVKFVKNATKEIGADGVIITASNDGDEIIHQAAEMSRQRGRIILVGVIGLNIRRDDFYKKELTFQVSCSYGPGRYDDNYEQKGLDYPISYVRWTEKRNFETILDAISSGQLDVKPLITQIVPFEDFDQIYGNMRKQGSIASILTYPTKYEKKRTILVNTENFEGKLGVFGIIGAGNFTSSTLIPNLKAAKANMKYIASASGLSAKMLAKKGEISYATSDYTEILKDAEVDTVLITTRHDSHMKFVIEALHAGKNVFVEKPLCLHENELVQIIEAFESVNNAKLFVPVRESTTLSGDTIKNKLMITVGFNRRFAPLAQKMKQLLGDGTKNIIATMNAGFIPANSWVHDLEIGGGRIIGEACHYIDLCTFLASSSVKAVCMMSQGINSQMNTDNATILLKYENGSTAVINYFANGSKIYSKERIEAYCQGKTIVLDNWRTLSGFGTRGFSKMKTRLDKGHKEQFRLFIESVKVGIPIIPFYEIVNTTKASFAAIQSLKEGRWIEIL